MLAAMSTHAKQLETAEVAYAAINEADKVILWQSKEFEKAGNSLQHDFKNVFEWYFVTKIVLTYCEKK